MDTKAKIDEVLSEISEDVRTVISEILSIEERYIHMALPRGIHDQIVEMVERVVK